MGIIYGRRNFISSDIIYYNIKRNNPNLENYFQHRSFRRGIEIQTFRDDILKESNVEFINGIFSLFSYREEMSFSDLKYFYTMFNPNDADILQGKLKFMAELLFNQQSYVEENIFKANLNKYFSHKQCDNFRKYSNTFLNKRSQVLKKGKYIIYKDEFLGLSRNQKNDGSAFSDMIQMMIIKKFVPSSLLLNSTLSRNNKFYNSFYCDCAKPKVDNEKVKKGIEEKYKELYMERLIKNIHDFTPEDFEKKLNKFYKINPLFIKAMIRYFKKKTLKNIINGINFVDLLYKICLAKKEEERIDLSFEIIAFPNTNEIPGKNLEEIFENEKEKPKIKKLSKEDYTKIYTDSVEPNQLTNFIKSISNCFDELNLYPYISGNEKAFEKNIIKAILEHYKEGKSYDEICKEKMKNENFFYAIDKNFIENLDKYLNDEIEEKPRINSQSICWKEINYDELLKPNLKYLTDFYVVPNKINSFFKEYFIQIGNDIILKKITYKKELVSNLTPEENEYYHPGQKDLKITNENNEIVEIEFYPIHIKVFLAKEIYNYLKNKDNNSSRIASTKEYIDLLSKLYDGKSRSQRSFIMSRLEIIDNIIKKAGYSHLEKPSVYFYNSFNFHHTCSETFEHVRLHNFCVLIIDSKFDEEHTYISHMQYVENEEYVKEEEQKLIEKKKKEEKEIEVQRKKEEENRKKIEEEEKLYREELKKNKKK